MQLAERVGLVPQLAGGRSVGGRALVRLRHQPEGVPAAEASLSVSTQQDVLQHWTTRQAEVVPRQCSRQWSAPHGSDQCKHVWGAWRTYALK